MLISVPSHRELLTDGESAPSMAASFDQNATPIRFHRSPAQAENLDPSPLATGSGLARSLISGPLTNYLSNSSGRWSSSLLKYFLLSKYLLLSRSSGRRSDSSIRRRRSINLTISKAAPAKTTSKQFDIALIAKERSVVAFARTARRGNTRPRKYFLPVFSFGSHSSGTVSNAIRSSTQRSASDLTLFSITSDVLLSESLLGPAQQSAN